MEKLGRALAEVRNQRGLRQSDLSELTRSTLPDDTTDFPNGAVTIEYIRKLESGDASKVLAALRAMCLALDVSADVILKSGDYAHPSERVAYKGYPPIKLGG